MHRAWAIKLGSEGRCVQFCEKHKIVGLGWKNVENHVLRTSTRDELADYIRIHCNWYKTPRQVGGAVGQLYRFAQECNIDDYILYYVPAKKHVVVCRVVGDAEYRDFDDDTDIDIWHFRRVEYPQPPIPILDFHGSIKGRLLGPRMSFWEIRPYDVVAKLAAGQNPSIVSAPDPEISEAYRKLQDLVLKRLESLNETDWEWLTVDYFKHQGASVDERSVGGNKSVIDFEATFGHGEIGSEHWQVQIKRYQEREVGWDAIKATLSAKGDGEARLCFVSVYGFSKDARNKAVDNEVLLLEAADFVRFVLSGKLRESLRDKLKIPSLYNFKSEIA